MELLSSMYVLLSMKNLSKALKKKEVWCIYFSDKSGTISSMKDGMNRRCHLPLYDLLSLGSIQNPSLDKCPKKEQGFP